MLSWVQDLSKIPRVKGGSAVKICMENNERLREAFPMHSIQVFQFCGIMTLSSVKSKPETQWFTTPQTPSKQRKEMKDHFNCY